jgi:glycosyltransferase involved in cell wall biosynthesis
MRVSIISAFDPVPGDDAQLIRYASLAQIFANHNHQVNYFSSSFFHLNKTQRLFSEWQDPVYENQIKLHLVKTNAYRKNISLLRLLNHYLFAVRLKTKFKQLINDQKPDLVIVAFPPVLSAHRIVKLCKKHHIPVVIDVQDIWPDAFRMIINIPLIYSLITFSLRLKRNYTFVQASKLSCVSETYRQYLIKFQPVQNIQVVNLGFNTTMFQQNISVDWNLLQKDPAEKWIAFLGTASHIPDLLNLPSIAAAMPGYRFILLGRNQAYHKIGKDVKTKNLNNVLVIGDTSFSNIVNILMRSDAGLLFIDPRSGTSLPNKLFYYLLAGLPVISNYSNTDLEKLSDDLKCIFFTKPADNNDLINAIQKAVSLSVTDKNIFRNFASENFDTDTVYTGYYNWITDIYN